MFASPSLDESPPAAGAANESLSDEEGVMEDEDDETPAAERANLFRTEEDDEDEEEDDDNEEEEEEVEEEEEEEDDDDDEDEEEEDDDDADPTTPATTTAATTTPTAPNTTTAAAAADNNNNNNNTTMIIRASASLAHLGPAYREMGKEALCWQLSSAKPGNGVEQIRDGSTDSYWQSDGVKQPHWIQITFARRVAISHVCLYLDYSLDESYTPKRVAVQYGMTSQDLQAAVCGELEFAEPVGWVVLPTAAAPDPLDIYNASDGAHAPAWQPIRTHLLRISILNMHQNGRDTHIRQCALYGPRRPEEQVPVVPPPSLRQPQTAADHGSAEDDDEDDMRWRPLSWQVGGVIR